MEKNYFASIEFNATNINILILNYYQNKLSVVASTSVNSSGYFNGEITDFDAFNASLDLAINDIANKYKIKLDEVILILPNNEHKVYSASVTNKVLTERQIIGKQQVDAIRKQLRSSKVNDGEILVDEVPTLFTLEGERHLRTAPINQRSSILKIRSNIHTLPKVIIEPLIETLNNKNIKVLGSVINCYCGVRASLNDIDLENACIHINFSSEVTTISAFYKNVLLKSVIVEFGCDTLINYLATTLKVSKEKAIDLFDSYFVCDVDIANDIIFDDELKLSERRISGILLNRLYNAFNEVLDVCNDLASEFRFNEDYFVLTTGYLNDIPQFVNEFKNYASLNIKEGNVKLTAINSQKFVNCYGAIVNFINLNKDFVINRLEKDESIEIENKVNTYEFKEEVKESSSNSRFKDIFDD